METMQTAVRDAIRHELEDAGVYPHPKVVDGCAQAAIEAAVPYLDVIVSLGEEEPDEAGGVRAP